LRYDPKGYGEHVVGFLKEKLWGLRLMGKVMESEYSAFYLARGSEIIEDWVEWDNLAGLKQLGHI
jgi:hypothetical protein